jgi:hypothetical protein
MTLKDKIDKINAAVISNGITTKSPGQFCNSTAPKLPVIQPLLSIRR